MPGKQLPPGEHLITFEELRELNGFAMPIRPHVRKLRPLSGDSYPGWLRGSTVISGIVYPWVVSDSNNEKWDLWAFRTWEDAYAMACSMVERKPVQTLHSILGVMPCKHSFHTVTSRIQLKF